MSAISKYLYVISLDALSSLDFQYISTLPNFKNFLAEASYCKNVYSVYPTLTYPAHVSIVTGKYPKNHGIVNNTLLQPNRKSPDWYWYRNNIRGDTFYDLAVEKGMKVGALLWPVTAKSKIQYNMPEIFANRFWKSQILVSLLNGTPLFQYELNKRFGYLRDGIRQPNLDNFVHQSLLYTIENKWLDLTLVHYTDLDSIRHDYGFNSREAKLALKRHDKRIGEIVQALKEKGIYEESTIIILGDHSSLDVNKIINLNILLRDRGYIEVNSKGKIIDYKAIFKSCDGCGYLYVKENNFKILKEITKLIEDFNGVHECIDAIYSREKALEFGADGRCSLLLEAKLPYYFQDKICGELIEEFNGGNLQRENGCKLCNHGYSPFKPDYTTVFMASGKGIKKGVIVEEMNLVDEGPTIAKLLGLELKNTDGKVLEYILDENCTKQISN
ncbi:ectonucleotide pyrophosphatase/phosphodiesterase [Clostridium kluyveri]|uniref:Alkaline phosphatase family protein n=1 Tax=Clostridium kluyveri TaxID=1534 RepID=A0A1L5F9M9_CLOKL|nr:ectonucleotide pyrophosphatase/phosphodiesterase [Clostridium kluyveri]APM39692.1 alkaline phosphatase family protein [Clostridium kluyveri]UZQ50150.1 ectonucleotide pyrophosphatase/phosphodiesterase [Clostridium kluyveri]